MFGRKAKPAAAQKPKPTTYAFEVTLAKRDGVETFETVYGIAPNVEAACAAAIKLRVGVELHVKSVRILGKVEFE
jgi:hypothetical protein